MRLQEHVRLGLQAWIPRKYRKLTAHSTSTWITTCFVWFGLALLLMLLIALPKIISLPNTIEGSLEKVTSLQVNADIELIEPVEVVSSPRTVLDLSKENITNERILLSNTGVGIRRFFWQDDYFVSWNTIQNITEHKEMYASWLSLLVIILLPSVLLIIGIIVSLEVMLLISICYVVALLVTRLTRFEVHHKSILKVCIISSIPFMIVHVVPLAYIRWIWLALACYLFIVIGGIWVIGESKLEREARQ